MKNIEKRGTRMDKLDKIEKILKTLFVMLVLTLVETIVVITFSSPLSTWNLIEFSLYVIAMLVGFYIVLKEILR